MTTRSDQQKARYWHRIEFALVMALAVVAGVGLLWSEGRNTARWMETKPRQ